MRSKALAGPETASAWPVELQRRGLGELLGERGGALGEPARLGAAECCRIEGVLLGDAADGAADDEAGRLRS